MGISYDDKDGGNQPKQNTNLGFPYAKFSSSQEIKRQELKSPINASLDTLKNEIVKSLKNNLTEEHIQKMYEEIIKADGELGKLITQDQLKKVSEEIIKYVKNLDPADINLFYENGNTAEGHQFDNDKFKNLITVSGGLRNYVSLLTYTIGHEIGHIIMHQSEKFMGYTGYKNFALGTPELNIRRHLDEAFADLIGAFVHASLTNDHLNPTTMIPLDSKYRLINDKDRFKLDHPLAKTRNEYVNEFLKSLNLNVSKNEQKFHRLKLQFEEGFKIATKEYESLLEKFNDALGNNNPLKRNIALMLLQEQAIHNLESQSDLGSGLEVTNKNINNCIALIDIANGAGYDTEIFINIFNASQHNKLINAWQKKHGFTTKKGEKEILPWTLRNFPKE